MDLDSSLTEVNSDCLSRTSMDMQGFHAPSNFLLNIPKTTHAIHLKKPKRSSNPRCVLLLRSLICEQMTHKFEKELHLDHENFYQCGNFKFFLNTLEILCHYLNIIQAENYRYRLLDYGSYKEALSGYLHKYETGNIITIQTYCSTSQNEFSDAMKLRLKSLDKRNPVAKRLISNYKVYASLCAQYHLRLKEIFQELTRLGGILNNISKDWKTDNPKSNSMFFIEGIWNPDKKMLYASNIKQRLENFELCIRDFEQCLIKCVIAYTDLNNAEQRYRDPLSRHLKTEGNAPNYYGYNTPTADNILLQKRLYQNESSDMQNPMLRLLSEPAPDEHRSPKFGKTMSHLNLNTNSRTPRNGGKTPPPAVMSFASSKKFQHQETADTLFTSGKNSSRGFNSGKGGVEVRPWAESKIEMLKSNKKRESGGGAYMTPVPLQKNFSFRTADTNVSSRGAMTSDSYAEVHRRCSNLIRMYSGSGEQQIRQQTTAGKPPRDMTGTGTSKKENMYIQSNYNTPRPSSMKQQPSIGKRTNERRLETEPSLGSAGNGGVDQLKNLFQQSKFVKGNIGLSSKLMKVR